MKKNAMIKTSKTDDARWMKLVKAAHAFYKPVEEKKLGLLISKYTPDGKHPNGATRLLNIGRVTCAQGNKVVKAPRAGAKWSDDDFFAVKYGAANGKTWDLVGAILMRGSSVAGWMVGHKNKWGMARGGELNELEKETRDAFTGSLIVAKVDALKKGIVHAGTWNSGK